MPEVFPYANAIIGAVALTATTCLAWVLAHRTSRQLKRSEATAQLIREWNGVEQSVVRYEVLKIAAQFYATPPDYSVVRLLINDDFEAYVRNLPQPTGNGLLAIQNFLIVSVWEG